MSIAPACVVTVSLFLLKFLDTSSWISLVIGMALFSVVYLMVLYLLSMNKDERRLFTEPVKRLIHPIK